MLAPSGLAPSGLDVRSNLAGVGGREGAAAFSEGGEGGAELSADERFLLLSWRHSWLPHSSFWMRDLAPEAVGEGGAGAGGGGARKKGSVGKRYMRPRTPFKDESRRQELAREDELKSLRCLLLALARRACPQPSASRSIAFFSTCVCIHQLPSPRTCWPFALALSRVCWCDISSVRAESSCVRCSMGRGGAGAPKSASADNEAGQVRESTR